LNIVQIHIFIIIEEVVDNIKRNNLLLIKRFLIYIALLSPFSVHSSETLDIIVGLSKPPYVLENIQQGYELELVTAILSTMDKHPNFIFVPFGRSEKMLSGEGIDALLTANANIIKNKASLSDVYITYQNVAISLHENAFDIKSISDLSKYTITSFQNAHKVLGAEFAKAANSSPLYSQVARQQAQLQMLLKGRTDVIVMDINIFNYFLKEFDKDFDKSQIKIHKIFPSNPYRIAFTNPLLVDKFNAALRAFKQTEDFKELKKRYELYDIK